MRAPFVCVAAIALAGLPAAARAQAAPPQPLTLEAAVAYAGDHYPALAAALEEVHAASAGIDVARGAFLPRLDGLWQSNRGTANNVFGQVLPQSVVPALSGPVLPAASGESVWGSATGALFSWEPVDFGVRHAGVLGAEAGLTRAQATLRLSRLDLQSAVASAFLTLLAAERTVVVLQADVDRRTVLARSIQTLVDNQLRPGADASRAEAERAAAETRLIQARQAVALGGIALGRLLGGPAVTEIDAARMIGGPPPPDVGASAARHPAVEVNEAAVEQARASETALAKADFPRLLFQASASARGSGASASGPFNGGFGGLKLARANWAAGFQVVFPNVFDFSTLRARKVAAAAETRAEVALDQEARLLVASDQAAAAALLQSARAVAANTPVQLAAARQSETQARARYDAGLASITEVADAQSVLAQAEAQDELARIEVWRALAASAAAGGDLLPFMALVRQP